MKRRVVLLGEGVDGVALDVALLLVLVPGGPPLVGSPSASELVLQLATLTLIRSAAVTATRIIC